MVRMVTAWHSKSGQTLDAAEQAASTLALEVLQTCQQEQSAVLVPELDINMSAITRDVHSLSDSKHITSHDFSGASAARYNCFSSVNLSYKNPKPD
jgi:hypothetical protein